MSRLKSSCARSAWTMSSGLLVIEFLPQDCLLRRLLLPPPQAEGAERLRAAVRRSSSGHRLLALELGPLPFFRREHLPQVLHRVPHVLEAQVQGRAAEAQDVGPARAEV